MKSKEDRVVMRELVHLLYYMKLTDDPVIWWITADKFEYSSDGNIKVECT